MDLAQVKSRLGLLGTAKHK